MGRRATTAASLGARELASSGNDDTRRGLRVIRGGRASEPRTTLRIAGATEDRPPFPVDAVVLEEDTYFVLSTDPRLREPAEHPIRIWTELHEVEPALPGSVVVRRGQAGRMLAVVHDLSQNPTWRKEWVASALTEVLRLVLERRIRGLGLWLLGAVYGKLGADGFMALLREALEQARPASLERLWLICPPRHLDEVRRRLDVEDWSFGAFPAATDETQE